MLKLILLVDVLHHSKYDTTEFERREMFMHEKSEIGRLELELELYANGARCEGCKRFFAGASLVKLWPTEGYYCEDCEAAMEAEQKDMEARESDFLRSRQ